MPSPQPRRLATALVLASALPLAACQSVTEPTSSCASVSAQQAAQLTPAQEAKVKEALRACGGGPSFGLGVN